MHTDGLQPATEPSLDSRPWTTRTWTVLRARRAYVVAAVVVILIAVIAWQRFHATSDTNRTGRRFQRVGSMPVSVAPVTKKTFDNQVDPTTGTVKLRAVFDNADGSLFPNQFVNVKLLVDKVVDATVVSVSAVQRGQQGTFVYVVNADNSVSVRPIVIHRQPESRQLRFCAHASKPRSPQDLTQLPKNLHI